MNFVKDFLIFLWKKILVKIVRIRNPTSKLGPIFYELGLTNYLLFSGEVEAQDIMFNTNNVAGGGLLLFHIFSSLTSNQILNLMLKIKYILLTKTKLDDVES